MMKYEVVIGLEVHLQLSTKTKAFCGCSTDFGSQPNSQVCPVCLGFPGSLPVYNKSAIEYALRVALALNCEVQEYTKFDRKNYFYPDLPKDYQISQYDLPLSRNGFLLIEIPVGERRIGIRRVHLEEDAGKLIHRQSISLVDFNRAGVPLLEIVTEPDIKSPEEAHEYLTRLKSILGYLDISSCDMEKGSLRCDANISLRPQGATELGTKSELKNLNSFRAVKDALAFEIIRQNDVLDSGGKVVQETRLWDAQNSCTVSMRSKEEAQDYRYFPEPDLPAFVVTVDMLSEARKAIPELPRQKLQRFVRDYGISVSDAEILVFSKTEAAYAESCMSAYKESVKKPIVNWLIGPLLSEANARNCSVADLKISPLELCELVGFLERQEISNLAAKTVLSEMIASGKSARLVINEKNLIQVSDESSLDAIIAQVINENGKSVSDFKAGKDNALMYLVGQAMKKSQGKANPKILQEIIKRRLTDA